MRMLVGEECDFFVPDNCTKYELYPARKKKITFLSEISQHAFKTDEKIAMITQNSHRAKFYFTSISGSWYLIMVLNMKEIHPAIMEECTRTEGLDPFLKFPTSTLVRAGNIF